MNCQDYEIALGDYVDGTLDERSRIELEAHLASCERCRAVVADFTALRQATLALEPELPPAHVWTKLAAAFETEQRSSFHGWGFTWKQSLAASEKGWRRSTVHRRAWRRRRRPQLSQRR